MLSENIRRVYGAQWRIFADWCGDVGLRPLPAEPLTVARYLTARAGSGASIATMRLATSAITKAHEWAGHESPCRDQGVRASLKGWGRGGFRSPSARPAPSPPSSPASAAAASKRPSRPPSVPAST